MLGYSSPSVRAYAARADDLINRYKQYAASIGCEIFQDSIMATEAQAEKLRLWWNENAKSLLTA